MRIPWQHQAFLGIGIALYFLILRFLLSGQGWFTVPVLGAEYGVARLKSFTFLVVGGQLFEFPFDLVLFLCGVAGVGIAMAAAARHFKTRGSNA